MASEDGWLNRCLERLRPHCTEEDPFISFKRLQEIDTGIHHFPDDFGARRGDEDLRAALERSLQAFAQERIYREPKKLAPTLWSTEHDDTTATDEISQIDKYCKHT